MIRLDIMDGYDMVIEEKEAGLVLTFDSAHKIVRMTSLLDEL